MPQAPQVATRKRQAGSSELFLQASRAARRVVARDPIRSSYRIVLASHDVAFKQPHQSAEWNKNNNVNDPQNQWTYNSSDNFPELDPPSPDRREDARNSNGCK